LVILAKSHTQEGIPVSANLLQLGFYKDFESMEQRLFLNFRVNDCARRLVVGRAFPLSQVDEHVEFTTSTVRELTGKDRATTTEVLDAVRRVGELLPAEAGPAIRFQYAGHPDEKLVVAMEPITIPETDARVYVFYVIGEGDLHAYGAYPECPWDGDEKFVYRVARK